MLLMMGRPVWRPVRIVSVVIGRLLDGPGQRVSAGGPVMMVRGRWRRSAVHVPAAPVGRRRGPVQRTRFRVVVTVAAAASASAAVRYQFRGKRYGRRMTQ